MKSRQELIEELNQSMQRSGTLTVLHTNAVAQKVGISATEFESMDLINHHQPMSAGHLAMRCGLTTGAITGIVDRLEQAGLVKRVRDPGDRRRVLLEPIKNRTRQQKICELYEPMSQAFSEITNELTTEQIRFLIDIHNKMNDRVEKIITELREK
ncbi:MAG TPA: MarR family transcriptional regulator [Candidatus Saccharimonadales bacterium]